MNPIKNLSRILTDEIHGEFHLTLEAEDGQTFRVCVTEKQITGLIQELEELLRYDEEDDLTERKELGDE
jgi:hypothetical protein